MDDIRQHQNHVTAGDIGFHFVIQASTQGDRSDVIYDILSRTDSPSYGYQLEMGATTLTESWDANPLHSQNHFMLGHAEEWFYRALAGVDFDLSRPEDEKIIIRPFPVGNIRSAEASYKSAIGKIRASWNLDGRRFCLDVVISPNTTATVYVPSSNAQAVSESGLPIRSRPGLIFLRNEANRTVLRAASGSITSQPKDNLGDLKCQCVSRGLVPGRRDA